MKKLLTMRMPLHRELQLEETETGAIHLRLLDKPAGKPVGKVTGSILIPRVSRKIVAKYFGLTMLLLTLAASADEPKLNIENHGTNIVVWVSGGTNTVQYWVLTSNDYKVNTTNWYEWRRFYPGSNNAVPVYDVKALTNQAASKPMRFFKLGAALP